MAKVEVIQFEAGSEKQLLAGTGERVKFLGFFQNGNGSTPITEGLYIVNEDFVVGTQLYGNTPMTPFPWSRYEDIGVINGKGIWLYGAAGYSAKFLRY
jgi:hypothetical protein